MKRIFSTIVALLFSGAAFAQSPDGSFILPYNLNPIGPLGVATDAVSTNFGLMTLAPQTSTSGDFFGLVNGNYSNGGGKLLAVLNGGQVFALTADGGWVQYNGGTTWSGVAAPVTPDQTMVTAGGTLVSPVGIWRFGHDALTGGKEIQLNGLPTQLAAASIENLTGTVVAKDSNGNWYQNSGWVALGADPNPYPVPQTITAAYLASNFHSTFSDNFTAVSTDIAPNATFGTGYKWYNGVEQCCMSPVPQPGNVGGAMYPTAVGANGPWNPYSQIDPTNGGLNITMHSETTTDSTHTYTSVFSGVMTSIASNKQGFLQQYGYFEAVMKFPPNIGTWPGFWMLSPSKNMEIDIVEYYFGNGHDPARYFATNHDWGNGGLDGPNQVTGVGVDLTQGYHSYGVLIDAGHTSFYLDRQLMASYPTRPDAKQPMYLLLDLGSGGGWPTCAGPSQVGVTPPPAGTSCGAGPLQLDGSVMAVQNVNVWQHN